MVGLTAHLRFIFRLRSRLADALPGPAGDIPSRGPLAADPAGAFPQPGPVLPAGGTSPNTPRTIRLS